MVIVYDKISIDKLTWELIIRKFVLPLITVSLQAYYFQYICIMIWTSLFSINMAQGLFLISLLTINRSKNLLASRLLIAMVILIILINLGYFTSRTELVHVVPQLFAVPFGVTFLFGPLFYFYSRSVIDNNFYWKKIYWLHLTPYLIKILLSIPLFTAGNEFWNWYMTQFLAGNLFVRPAEKVFFTLQSLHLLIYLFFTVRWLQAVTRNKMEGQYLVPLSSRIKWLRSFTAWFALFVITGIVLFIYILAKGKYDPVTNYFNTIVSSCIIYFIAYSMVLKPGFISPDFAKKYKTYKQFNNEDGESYLIKLSELMDKGKVFTDPDFKLLSLAEQIKLPSHQVSKLINEKFGKSFNDLVNEYRVNEFINRVNQPQYQSFTLFGVAMEVGFNSKSSFNTAFKKVTGKNPSDFKTPV